MLTQEKHHQSAHHSEFEHMPHVSTTLKTPYLPSIQKNGILSEVSAYES